MKFELRLYVLVAIVLAPLMFAGPASAGAANPQVAFETSMGTFRMELYPDRAPQTVANFLEYVDDGFYENTLIHRSVPDFVIQGGGFVKGMKPKETRDPVKNESDNRLRNLRGTVAMARRFHPDTGTSQFYINLVHNVGMDYKSKVMPGYTVFGKVIEGMDVIDRISNVPTHVVNEYNDVPKEDVVVLSVRRKGGETEQAGMSEDAETEGETFVAGEDYVVLERPVPTRDRDRIEVVEMFSYGCPHCYEFEPLVKDWGRQQADDVDFWFFPAVWNTPMALYAQAFYTAEKLGVADKIHRPLFTAIVIEQENIHDESDLAEFFGQRGVDKARFTEVFNSAEILSKVKHAEERVRLYKPAGVPEVIVNGRYRVDRMRAGGLSEMLAVIDFLVEKERGESAD